MFCVLISFLKGQNNNKIVEQGAQAEILRFFWEKVLDPYFISLPSF